MKRAVPTLAGEKAERVMVDKIGNVQVRDVECDEAWSLSKR